MQRIVIAGTDTSVGKTILSALFMSSIESLYYWKPVQSGLEDETDPETVRRLSECSSNRIIAEVYKLQQPLSPHLSARLDGITIDENKLGLPAERDLIIEAAGGVLVPMNDNVLQVDVIAMWQIP
ncbi:MAG TPA: ATP-dependent dethiobiotin synthetase BioD, partial [Steroidobacteraceae bacterium]|nr:ATP-dependent dethiobiotin synthetase BioD [Steroidobacteraceae bacterium]